MFLSKNRIRKNLKKSPKGLFLTKFFLKNMIIRNHTSMDKLKQ
jgi:hypothetical protein